MDVTSWMKEYKFGLGKASSHLGGLGGGQGRIGDGMQENTDTYVEGAYA
jgi:hypothetical protein